MRSTAWLFPLAASPFTPAVASFALSDTQELPPIAPGDVVWVKGTSTPGAAGVEVHADGVVLRPTGPIEGGMGRGFADVRGSRPLVHLARATSLSPYARAWVAGEGVTKATWDPVRWVDQYRTETRCALGAVIVLIGLFIYDRLTGSNLSPSFLVHFVGLGLFGIVRAHRRRRRVRKAVDELGERSPGARPVTARLWWSPSPDGGAMAWVSLSGPDHRTPATPPVSLPVVGLPRGWSPDQPFDALVEGELREGAVVRVHVDGVVLHLAGPCRTDVGPAPVTTSRSQQR